MKAKFGSWVMNERKWREIIAAAESEDLRSLENDRTKDNRKSAHELWTRESQQKEKEGVRIHILSLTTELLLLLQRKCWLCVWWSRREERHDRHWRYCWWCHTTFLIDERYTLCAALKATLSRVTPVMITTATLSGISPYSSWQGSS